MARWGGVKDDHVPRGIFHVFEQFVKGKGLVQTGKDHVSGFDVGLHVLEFLLGVGIQHHAKATKAAHTPVATHVVHRLTHFWQEVGEFGFGIHLESEQAGDTLDRGGHGSQFNVQGIRRGVRRVAGNQQHAQAAVGKPHGGGRRGGGLADTAFSAKQEESSHGSAWGARCLNPTPEQDSAKGLMRGRAGREAWSRNSCCFSSRVSLPSLV